MKSKNNLKNSKTNKNSQKRKQLTIMGQVWDFWPVLGLFDQTFDSKFVSFYSPWLKGNLQKEKIINFNEDKFHFILTPFRLIRRIYKLHKVIKDFNPDIITSHHDEANITNLILIFIENTILRKNISFVGFMRSGAKEYDNNSLYFKFKKFIIKHFYKNFTVIFTPSLGNKTQLEKKFKLKNFNYIYNPVDVKYYTNQAKEDLTPKQKEKYFPKNHQTFVTVGRLTLQKAQWVQLKIFKEIIKKHPKAKLLIIGGGELETFLKLKINVLGLKNNVFLLGHQKNIYKFVKHSRAFILTSFWESFGNVIVESLSLNKLVISTDCKSGPREILAPQISFREKINYPYKNEFGVLANPLNFQNETEYDFKKPLDKQETQIKELIEKVCVGKLKEDKKAKERLEYFNINNLKDELDNKIL